MSGVQPSATRRMLAVWSRPGTVAFAGGLPAADIFNVKGDASACQIGSPIGATAGSAGLRAQLCAVMKARDVSADSMG